MAYLTQEEIPVYCPLIKETTMAHVESASFLIDAYKGTSFKAQNYTELVSFLRSSRRKAPFEPYRGKLRHLPRIEVTDIKTTVRSVFNPREEVSFDSDCIDFDGEDSLYFSFYPPQNNIIMFRQYNNLKQIRVSYRAGYEEGEYPENLKQAVGMLAQNLAQVGGTLQWKSREDYDTKITLANNSVFTDEIKNLIESVSLS